MSTTPSPRVPHARGTGGTDDAIARRRDSVAASEFAYAADLDGKLPIAVTTIAAQRFAAVRARCAIAEIPHAFRAPLDQVWAFLRRHPELRPGHNLFRYHHPAQRTDVLEIDFGVEVDRAFPDDGAVICTTTPAGAVVTAVHRGPYDRLRDTHDAIHAWCAAHGRAIGGSSWETYGDWTADPARLETTVTYALR